MKKIYTEITKWIRNLTQFEKLILGLSVTPWVLIIASIIFLYPAAFIIDIVGSRQHAKA